MASSRRHDKTGTIKYVQIDGLVALKMVKHCQEEVSDESDIAQGVLLGLVENDKLEVTNCFPFPRQSEGDMDFNEMQYQMEMMRNLRHVNVDHLHVGWYQNTHLSTLLNRTLVDSQFNYQSSIHESVVLIYDPLRTVQGKLTLKAYRLTPQMMEFYKGQDFTADAMKKFSLNCTNVLEEIPIVLKNSHLLNMLMCELETHGIGVGRFQQLDLGSGAVLERSQQLLMSAVDDLSAESQRYTQHLRSVGRIQAAKQQALHKRTAENLLRQEKGEDPVPDDDIHRNYRIPAPPPKLDQLLAASQMHLYCEQLNKLSTQAFAKLFVADAVHEKPSSTSS